MAKHFNIADMFEMVADKIPTRDALVCGEQRHELAGRAKDMGSAAVFMSQVIVVLTWGLIFYHNVIT